MSPKTRRWIGGLASVLAHLGIGWLMLSARASLPEPQPLAAAPPPIEITMTEPRRPPPPVALPLTDPGAEPGSAAPTASAPVLSEAPQTPPTPPVPTPPTRKTPPRPTTVTPFVAAQAVAPATMATVSEADLVGALRAGGSDGEGSGTAGDGGPGAGSGVGGGSCDMVARLQEALREDDDIRRAVAEVQRGVGGRALLVWDGDWRQNPGQAGKGLAGVRQAIALEVAFAPAACRAQPMRGLVLVSLADGPGGARVALGTGRWRWSDLLS